MALHQYPERPRTDRIGMPIKYPDPPKPRRLPSPFNMFGMIPINPVTGEVSDQGQPDPNQFRGDAIGLLDANTEWAIKNLYDPNAQLYKSLRGPSTRLTDLFFGAGGTGGTGSTGGTAGIPTPTAGTDGGGRDFLSGVFGGARGLENYLQGLTGGITGGGTGDTGATSDVVRDIEAQGRNQMRDLRSQADLDRRELLGSFAERGILSSGGARSAEVAQLSNLYRALGGTATDVQRAVSDALLNQEQFNRTQTLAEQQASLAMLQSLMSLADSLRPPADAVPPPNPAPGGPLLAQSGQNVGAPVPGSTSIPQPWRSPQQQEGIDKIARTTTPQSSKLTQGDIDRMFGIIVNLVNERASKGLPSTSMESLLAQLGFPVALASLFDQRMKTQPRPTGPSGAPGAQYRQGGGGFITPSPLERVLGGVFGGRAA